MCMLKYIYIYILSLAEKMNAPGKDVLCFFVFFF